MDLYKVEINKNVRKKDLVSIPSKDVSRIVERIKKLAEDPYPENSTILRGRQEYDTFKLEMLLAR